MGLFAALKRVFGRELEDTHEVTTLRRELYALELQHRAALRERREHEAAYFEEMVDDRKAKLEAALAYQRARRAI